MYNLTNVTNANNIYEIVKEANSLGNGLPALLLLFAVFIFTFIALKNYDTKTGFIASSFASSVLAGLLLAVGFISFPIFLFPFLLLVSSIIFKVFTD